MAGELVASVVVDGLLSKLRSGLWSELGLLWSFKDDLEDLKNTLVSVQAVLHDAEKRSFKEESVRLWLKRLKAAAYDIEDMLLDKFQIQKHPKVQVLKSYNVKSCFSIPVMAHKLKGMKKRLDKIAEERSRYNLIKEDTMTDQQVTDGRITFSTVNRADVLGRDEEATEIINRLLMPTTEDICIIPIVGIGGLGKTTLAKLIIDDDRIKKVFELRIWVHAMDFKVDKLVEEILLSSRSENRNTLGNLQSGVERIKEILNGRRYLIVLDDVWNEDKQIWEDFKQVLDGGKESRIIVTTRSERVGLTMCAEMPHKLKPLPDDVCLGLFDRRAFGSAGAKDIHLASIGKEIVKKCQGVPLTANSLGGMLYLEKGEAAWKKVRDSDIWRLEDGSGSQLENKIISSLKLSYQQMASPLKQCFVYCSSFPKAFSLDRDMLIQQWIAQRFIQTKDEIESLQIGDDYVNYLLSISFLEEEIARDLFGDEITYMKMHDLVYDLARWVAGDEVSVLDALESEKDNATECRYASVINYNGQSNELGKALPRKVRALHFQKCTSLHKEIFSYTECLRVLEFTSCDQYELPTSIYRLKQLRYLRLPDHLFEVDEQIGNIRTLESLIISNRTVLSAIHTLPTSIGKLHKLNSLKIISCYSLKSLPEFLGNLVKLVTLKIRNCDNLRSLPESLGNLKKLETLTIYDCRAIRNLPESLSNLVNLKILAIGKLSNFPLPASIWKLQNLIDLDLSFFDELLELPDSIGRLPKLNSLELYGCHNLESLPESLGNLKELRTLDIRGCAMLDQDELPTTICSMRHLKIQRDEPLKLLEFDTSDLTLHLIDGGGRHVVRNVTDAKRINLKKRGGSIKSLTYKCGGYGNVRQLLEPAMLEALQPHQNLQELFVLSAEGSMFPSWMRSQMGLFLPNLVKITVKRITNWEHLPVLGQLPKLEEIVIEDMTNVRRISEELCGARNTTAGASFPSLKRLDLWGMDQLEEWVTAAMAGDDGERGASLFPCLEHLTIRDCPKLRRIHPCIPPSVKRLELGNMDELEELVTAVMAEDDGERGASLFPCLEHLSIKYCPKLRRIHPCIPPSVRRLSVSYIDRLHLLTLDVPEMPLLKYLHLEDDDLDSFPESIRRLTSLEALELGSCESLATFPEWLGELSQLQNLEIKYCPRIDSLPQSIERLTALKRLHIRRCSESLLERTRKETGEDWGKISHIGEIQITS